jgi:Pterin-4a-carbinolamine dehydratase
MKHLSRMKCEACRSDAPTVSAEDEAEFQKQVPDWVVLERDSVKRLERVYKFKDFVSALDFTNKVGELAESEGHHPAILTEWGSVGVAWWTHAIHGLHRNDYIMAAKTDELFKKQAR